MQQSPDQSARAERPQSSNGIELEYLAKMEVGDQIVVVKIVLRLTFLIKSPLRFPFTFLMRRKII
jgi:hypothetical protein